MARERDYREEYRRRIERGRARGLTRSQARGHPRAAEKLASESLGRAQPAKSGAIEPPLGNALRRLHNGESLTRAAAAEGVSRERFRRFVAANELARREGRKWVMTDTLPRRLPMIAKDGVPSVTVLGFKEASRIGRYWNDVGRFLRTNDIELLAPYRGQGASTTNGRVIFETDPNALHRHASAGLPAFHEVYEITQ